MVRFDRAAPGEGMIIYSRIENDKAYLEFQFFLKTSDRIEEYLANIRIYDKNNTLALEILYPLGEEELAKGMLLHPHLWRGVSDPYLYSVKVHLLKKEKQEVSLDVLEKSLPLRTFENLSGKGWFLNGETLSIHPVHYTLLPQIANGMWGQEPIRAKLQLLRQMGANTIVLSRPEFDEEFAKQCEEMGFLLWYVYNESGKSKDKIPHASDLLTTGIEVPTDLYYFYKAAWSKEPFVYIVRKTLKRQKNGNFSLTVFSNQKKVALYAEGVLFEIQTRDTEFQFEEIPAKKYPLQLTVEAGECSVSLTAYY